MDAVPALITVVSVIAGVGGILLIAALIAMTRGGYTK
jgi:hypothetical protein